MQSPVVKAKPLPHFYTSGFSSIWGKEDTKLPFHFEERLQETLALHDPSLPFPGEPFPTTLYQAPVSADHLEFDPLDPQGKAVLVLTSSREKEREKARQAALRDRRYRTLQSAVLGLRLQGISRLFTSRAVLRVRAEDGLDPAVTIEDRLYDLEEVLGEESKFGFTGIDCWGRGVRVVASEKRVATLLAGNSGYVDWAKKILAPVNADLLEEAAKVEGRSPQNAKLELTSGVGARLNLPKVETPRASSRVLDALSMGALLSTVPMKRMLSYGNSVLETYCKETYDALKSQKDKMLADKPEALYPCETSVYSAITINLNDPRVSFDILQRIDPAVWCILTAAGDYNPDLGGQLILWDVGRVVRFPAGTCALIPAALVRFSFVKVRPDERQHTILQWAGVGIRRYFENGSREDGEFAMEASADEYRAREKKRRAMHADALRTFPLVKDVPEGWMHFDYRGENPPPSSE